MEFKKLSIQNKSFVVVCALLTAGAFSCAIIAILYPTYQPFYTRNDYFPQNHSLSGISSAQAARDDLDTSRWKTMEAEGLGFRLKIHPAWSIVQKPDYNGYAVFEILTHNANPSFKIYVSKTAFYEMDALPLENIELGGIEGQSASELLYGFKHKGKYLTFDIGQSVVLEDYFKAMMQTVRFF